MYFPPLKLEDTAFPVAVFVKYQPEKVLFAFSLIVGRVTSSPAFLPVTSSPALLSSE